MSIYALGIWKVKEQREGEFLTLWDALAEGTKLQFPGAPAVLLRDREDLQTFISFGPWESLAQIEEWRGSAHFKRSVAGIREVLDSFKAYTMNVVRDIS